MRRDCVARLSESFLFAEQSDEDGAFASAHVAFEMEDLLPGAQRQLAPGNGDGG